MARDIERHLPIEDLQMRAKQMKRRSTSYDMRVPQIEMTMRHHYILIRMAKIQNINNTKCWQGCGTTGAFIHAGGNAEWCSHFGRKFGSFLQN